MNDWVTNLTQDLPVWAVPAVIVHIALFLALIVPTWRAFSRARAGGYLSLVLILPGLGLLVVAGMMAGVVLRRANWSPVWFILVLIPVVNIVFMWLFAFAAWSERSARPAAAAPPDEPWEPAPHAPLLGDEAKTKPPAAHAIETAPPPPPPPTPSPPPPPAPTPPPAPAAPPPPPPPAVDKAPADPPKAAEPDLTLVARAPAAAPEKPGRTVPGGPYDESGDLPEKSESKERAPSKSPSAPKGRAWQLTGANDRAAGLDFAVFEEDLRQADNGLHIGRSTRSNIILEDESVSRNHARLILADGELKVEDLDSMNGTWVDGEKAESGNPLELSAGVEVEFGKLKLVVTER